MNPDDFESRLVRQPFRAPPDKWREEILRASAPAAPPSSLSLRLSPWWRELLWPCPQAWAALAAVWVALLLVNRPERPTAAELARHGTVPAMPVPWLAEEQLRLMAELSLFDEPPPKPRPPAVAPPPRPRSEWSDSASAV